MSETGIGAAAVRKQDLRFIQGRGQYADEVNREGQTHACSLRSPHAHANIGKIDTSAADTASAVTTRQRHYMEQRAAR